MAVTKPFYPGYYPGDPMIRPPGGGGGGIIEPTTEFEYDALLKELDELDLRIEDLPKWVRDQIESDVKLNLRAAIFPKKTSLEETGRHDEEETEEIPGAFGLIVGLDPREWAKDPKKQVSKILEGTKGVFFDYSDFNARRRGELWKSIVSKPPPAIQTQEPKSFATKVKEQATKAIESEALAYRPEKSGAFQLEDLNTITPEVNTAGKKLGNEIVNFQQNMQVSFFRDENHDKILGAAVDGVVGELEAVQPYLSDTQKAAVGGFIARVRFAKGIKETDKLVGKVETEIEKYLLETRDASGIRKALTKLHTHLHGDGETPGVFEKMHEVEGLLGEAQARRLLGPYQGILKEISEAIGDPETLLEGSGLFDTRAKLLARRIHSVRSPGLRRGGLVKGDVFRSSAERNFLRALEKEILEDSGGLLEEASRSVAAMGHDSLISRIQRHLPKQAADREWHMASELVDNLEGGKMSGIYLWSRIKEKLYGYTPAYSTGKFVERIHALGLIIQDEHVEATPRNLIQKGANVIAEVGYSLGVFKNTFSFNIDLGGKKIPLKTQGGKHFKAVLTLGSLLTDGDLDAERLAGLMRAKPKNVKAYLQRLGLKDKVEDFDNFTKNVRKLLRELRSQEWGLDVTDGATLEAIIRGLNSFSATAAGKVLAITKKYAGLLERATRYLNVLQDKILSGKIGKRIATVLDLKNVIAASISNAIVTAISAATEGIGATIAVPLKTAIQWVIKKVLDFGQTLGKAIFTAELSSVDELLEGSLKLVIKVAKWAMGLAILPFALVMFCFVVLLGAISPTNPAKGIGGDYQTMAAQATEGEGGVGVRDSIVAGICPLPNGYLTTPSYGRESAGSGAYYVDSNGYSRYGHGTDTYWNALVSAACSYNMPSGYIDSQAPDGPIETGSICYASAERKNTNYGKAADFDNSPYGGTGRGVFAPKLPGVESWTISGTTTGQAGQGVILRGSGDHDYIIWILHMNNNTAMTTGSTVAPGDHLGDMWNLWEGSASDNNVHIHVELSVDGTSVRPESWLCN